MLLLVFRLSHGLDDLGKLVERLLVLGGQLRLGLAPRIRALEGAEHGARHRDRVAAVGLLADEVELGTGFGVALEAVQPQPIVDLGKAAGMYLRTVLRNVDR